MTAAELADRRQRAIEAAWDQYAIAGPGVAPAIELAVETATRVQITDEMLAKIPLTRADAYDVACDLFAAAGFEIEE